MNPIYFPTCKHCGAEGPRANSYDEAVDMAETLGWFYTPDGWTCPKGETVSSGAIFRIAEGVHLPVYPGQVAKVTEGGYAEVQGGMAYVYNGGKAEVWDGCADILDGGKAEVWGGHVTVRGGEAEVRGGYAEVRRGHAVVRGGKAHIWRDGKAHVYENGDADGPGTIEWVKD